MSNIAVGYVNDERKYALVHISKPALTSEYPRPDFVQFAVTVEDAGELQEKLAAFLERDRAAGG